MNDEAKSIADDEATVHIQGQQPRSDGFDFHEPEFVHWWLRSHFLLSVDDQIAVAENLRRVVAVPEVHEAIDQFILSVGHLVPEDERMDVGSSHAPDDAHVLTPKTPMEAAALGALKVWNERRGLCYLLGAIIFVYAAKGTYTLFKGATQLLA
jgi:hypothetical protein